MKQVVVGGVALRFPEGVVRFYVFDIQNRKQRELGEVVIGHHATSKRNSLTGLRREKEFLADALERIRSHECEGWCLVALDITRDDGSVAKASLTSYAVQSDRLVFSYVLVLQMR